LPDLYKSLVVICRKAFWFCMYGNISSINSKPVLLCITLFVSDIPLYGNWHKTLQNNLQSDII